MKNLKTLCLLFSLSLLTAQTNFAQDAKSYYDEGTKKLNSRDYQNAMKNLAKQ